MARIASLGIVLLALFVPGAVLAQGRAIHSTSDALYIGVRAEPGGAYLFAYDLDILVTDASSGVSIGPSFSVSFGGSDATDLGRRQEYLLVADFLRARITLAQAHGFRGMALIGAGMYFTSLYEQVTAEHPALLPDGSPVLVREHYPSAFVPGAILTGGLGADWYFTDQWGICAYLVGHVRLDDQPRMPVLWVELGVGVRFGE